MMLSIEYNQINDLLFNLKIIFNNITEKLKLNYIDLRL